MKNLLRPLWVPVFILLLSGAVIAGSSSGSRMLKEVAEPGQSVKHMEGLPVIISKKHNLLALKPESIFPGMNEPVQFTLIISNPTEQPWSFSIKDLKAYSGKKELKILGPEKIIAGARKKYSQEEYKISKEQVKALAPYVEQKMQTLRDSLIKSRDIPAGGKVSGLLFIEVPPGTENLTVEVAAPKETHKFSFNVIEL